MKREVKIGLFAVLVIGAAWAGVRFLSGIDIFSRNSEYYAAYDQINGVQSASPIMMRGVKIGTVTGVSFNPARSDKVVLRFTIKREYHIPTNSEAKIFSNGFMGAKAIEITYGDAATYLQRGDTLRSSRDRDLMDMAGSELEFFKQKFSLIVADLSKTLNNVNTLIETNQQSLTGTMANLNNISSNVAGILSAERQNLQHAVENLAQFSAMLGNNAERIDSIVGDVSRMTGRLAEDQFAQKLTSAMGELNTLLTRINDGEGTVGQLMNDKQLYESLDQASKNLASLLSDLKANPGRYVHLSLFGSNPEKAKAKAEKRAAKVAAQAERDSLKRLR